MGIHTKINYHGGQGRCIFLGMKWGVGYYQLALTTAFFPSNLCAIKNIYRHKDTEEEENWENVISLFRMLIVGVSNTGHASCIHTSMLQRLPVTLRNKFSKQRFPIFKVYDPSLKYS